MLFHEVIIKSQILSNKFIRKNPRSLPYNLPSKIFYAILNKPIDITYNVKVCFPCGLILQKNSKFSIPLKSAGKYF